MGPKRQTCLQVIHLRLVPSQFSEGTNCMVRWDDTEMIEARLQTNHQIGVAVKDGQIESRDRCTRKTFLIHRCMFLSLTCTRSQKTKMPSTSGTAFSRETIYQGFDLAHRAVFSPLRAPWRLSARLPGPVILPDLS